MKKKQKFKPIVLDYSDMSKIVEDSRMPRLRAIVKDLSNDSYKRSLFLTHLRQVKEHRQQSRLNLSPFGTNHVETNQSRNFQDYLVTHTVEKKEYFNSLDDRRTHALKQK